MEIAMSKDTKILIPEIPGEWTERSRSGQKRIWNDGWHGRPHRNGLPYVELTAPEKGFICKPCRDPEDATARAAALAKVAEAEYDEWDYRAQDECKCPHCATVIHIESKDYGDKNMDCDTYGGLFSLQLEHSVTFTTTVIGERITRLTTHSPIALNASARACLDFGVS